jgi:hypothetical protein
MRRSYPRREIISKRCSSKACDGMLSWLWTPGVVKHLSPFSVSKRFWVSCAMRVFVSVVLTIACAEQDRKKVNSELMNHRSCLSARMCRWHGFLLQQ